MRKINWNSCELINLKFDPFSTLILPLFSYNLSTNLSKKGVEYTFLTYYALSCPISWSAGLRSRKWEFPAGFAKNDALGSISNMNEASTKPGRTIWRSTADCRERTVSCRIRTAVPRSQRLRTVEHTTVLLNRAYPRHARVPVRRWHDRASLILSRFNQFRKGRLGGYSIFSSFLSLKKRGDF